MQVNLNVGGDFCAKGSEDDCGYVFHILYISNRSPALSFLFRGSYGTYLLYQVAVVVLLKIDADFRRNRLP